MLTFKELLIRLACNPLFLSSLMLLIAALLVLCANRKFVLEHELGHARMMLHYLRCFNSSSPVFVLMAFPCRKGAKFKTNGIQVYYLGKEMRDMFGGKKIDGIAIWDMNVIPLDKEQWEKTLADNDITEPPFLRITKNGVNAGRHYLFNLKRIFLYFCLSFAVHTCAKWALGEMDAEYLIRAVVLSLVNTMLLCLIIYLKVWESAGFFPKKTIDKYEETIVGSEDGAIIDPIICDSAKIKYFDQYMDCNQRFKDKKLQNKYSYSTVTQLLKNNFGIDVFKDYDNIDSIKEL